jgi:AraC family transcriptional regulator
MADDYRARINRVLDHIQDHLDDDLPLGELAQVAHLSPYHFHRIFRALTGEPVGQFVRRLRLERAARHLCDDPERPVTTVALDAGFATSAAFAKAFRDRFGMSASAWRASGDRKNGQAMRKVGHAPARVEAYFGDGATTPKWRVLMNDIALETQVEVRTLPERTVAYVRHTGPYQGNAELFGRLFGQLAAWAGPRGLLGSGAQFLSVYHDDPAVTDDDKLRVICGCVVPADTEVGGEIGKTQLAGGAYAVGRFELSPDQYAAAWDALYGQWLPSSGYQADDRPAFEQYLNDPESHPEKKHIVEICIPVRPA